KPGSRITLGIWRGGKARDVPVTVAEFKDDEAKAAEASKGKAKKAENRPGKLGIAVIDLTGEQRKALKIANGVMVEAVEGAAAAAQIEAGDVILRVNNVDVASAKAFNETVARLDPKKPVALLIRDENGTRFVTFRPEGE
ncbi:MAG TPA: PDZ domain-containing protein, partial [Usitatibacter sp.]|nr:PDZ domain-containing protein [Usitatibacter sp.]